MRRRAEVIKSARTSFGIRTLDEVIREQVKRAWIATAHDAVLAAQCLGISRTTMYRYLKRYGLDRWA